MKRLFLALAFVSSLAFAEASFDQIEALIQQQNYSAAAAGLEEIIKNHPKSAKAFYAMAQAQAGLGNQEKARKALDIATGLNPTLDFAPASSVQSLREAITPQVKKIEAIEESHFWRNTLLAVLLASLIIYFAIKYKEKLDDEEAALKAAQEAEREAALEKIREANRREDAARQQAKDEAVARMKAHPNYGHERFDPENPDKLKTVKRFKEEKAAAELREAQARAEAAEAEARRMRYSGGSGGGGTTTVVQGGGSGDMLTGIMIGNMLSDHGHHETTRVVEREVIRETPSRDSSWDDTPARTSSSSGSSRSSSWDDDSSSSSSSRSSSWSDSSSSSSSSWDSSSSSSDSSSSSSWD